MLSIKLLAIPLAALAFVANAAQFVSDPKGRSEQIIMLAGTIESGDANKFAAIIVERSRPIKTLLLDSNGGSLVEGIKIAEIVRELHISVMVEKPAICASSCFFIFLSGAGRTATSSENRNSSISPLGPVGLHRPYLSSPLGTADSLKRQTTAMKSVKSYLESYLVPSRLIDLMLSRPSNDIYWLTRQDLDELGSFPPELEELFIAKCNYDRKMTDKIILLEQQGLFSEVKILEKIQKESNRCIADLQLGHYHESVKKLKNGWLPSVSF